MNQVPLRPEEKATFVLRGLYASYGYSPFKMTKFEEYDLYVKNKSFLLSDHIITFTDTDGKLMALKPDVTLSIVKNHKDEPNTLQKVYYNENVYRVSGKTASYREIMQTGLECIGEVDTYCLCEVLTLAIKSLEAISKDCVLTLSDLNLVSDAIALTGASYEASKKLLVCVGEKNRHGIDTVLAEEGIEPEKGEVLKTLLSCYGKPEEVICTLKKSLPDAMQSRLCEFEALIEAVASDKIRIDFSTVSDLRYYNGVVFKGFVKKIPTDLLSGGQYDKLMQKMKKNARAVGFAVYLDLLEDFERSAPDYDYDTVVLYQKESDLKELRKTVEALTQENKRVLATCTLPENKRYQEVIYLTKSEEKA